MEKVRRVPGHARAMVKVAVHRDDDWSVYHSARYDSNIRATGGAALLGLGLVVTFSSLVWLFVLLVTIGMPVLMGVVGFLVGLALIFAGGKTLDGKL